MKIKKNTGFSDIFLLKSPRPVIPNLGTHRTELRQVRAVRADFEVFEWNLTVLGVCGTTRTAARAGPREPKRCGGHCQRGAQLRGLRETEGGWVVSAVRGLCERQNNARKRARGPRARRAMPPEAPRTREYTMDGA